MATPPTRCTSASHRSTAVRSIAMMVLALVLPASAAEVPPLAVANHLANEHSPYLLQHAHNPVDWYPWGPEAFAKAVAENKPIFLSIGYSTCHWCHVMERESFEDPAIAELINHSYVAIKVDREERPDIDRVFMDFIQATTGSGGWPMTVFLTPDRKPFVGGTYFPPHDDHGIPGLASILPRIADAWLHRHDDVIQQADGIITALARATTEMATPGRGAAIGEAERHAAYTQLSSSADATHGGFGVAPKFPEPVQLAFLLDYGHRAGETHALELVLSALHAIAAGGIHDQLAGGIHRYSTDDRWFLPHFEKMLYDQAQLVMAALDAYQLSHDAASGDLARDLLTYVLADMTGPDGQFYAAEDADSPRPPSSPGGLPGSKAEGAFYVWSASEVEQILGQEQAALVGFRLGIQPGGNVAADPRGEFPGLNVLAIVHTVAETAAHAGISEDEARQRLAASCHQLAAVRAKRPRPDRDNTVIASWNGLMISAFARAGAVLDDDRFRQAALRAATFLLTHLMRPDGQLCHSWCAGHASASGYLADAADAIQAWLDCYETTLDAAWLARAIALQAVQDAHFADDAAGGYFTNAGDDPHLVRRLIDEGDTSEPAGVSVAVRNLTRLARMLDDVSYGALADRACAAWAARCARTPLLMPALLAASASRGAPGRQIVIAGDPHAPDVHALLRVLAGRYQPDQVILGADGGDGQRLLASHVAAVAAMTPLAGKATAYVCDGFVCHEPVSSPAELAALLDRPSAPAPR